MIKPFDQTVIRRYHYDRSIRAIDLGYDCFGAAYWYEILAENRNNPVLKINRGIDGDQTRFSIEFQSDAFGEYRFAFSKGISEELLIHSVQANKTIGNSARDDLGQVSSFGADGDLKDCVGHRLEYKNFVFEAGDDHQLIKSIDVEFGDENRGQTWSPQIAKITVLDRAPSKIEIGSTIRFSDYEIPNGTPVKVFDDPKIPYEFFDGRIVRVVSADSIISNESARFEEGNFRGSTWLYGAVTVLLVVIASVSAWMIRSRK